MTIFAHFFNNHIQREEVLQIFPFFVIVKTSIGSGNMGYILEGYKGSINE